METPVRRVTRSQMSSLGPSSGAKPAAVATGAGAGAGWLSSNNGSTTKKKELPRTPFTDLTNDSPISGLMPAKMATKDAACVYESTPRSKLRPADSNSRPIGEDLLRMQVTSLLRKVEAEALKEKNNNSKNATTNAKTVTTVTAASRSSVSEMFESPMRLAAPTPANTPAALGMGMGMCLPAEAASVVEVVKESSTVTTNSLQVIVISSPVVSNLEVPLELEKKKSAPPSSVQPSNVPELKTEAHDLEQQQQEQEMPTTRTLQFDSPEKDSTLSSHSVVENVSSIANLCNTASPGSVTTAEILASIDEGPVAPGEGSEPNLLNQPTTRTLEFDSPAKKQNAYSDSSTLAQLNSSPSSVMPLPLEQMDIESGLFFSSNADHHRALGNGNAETDGDDEDAWSVIVNVHSPEKTEGTDRFLDCDVASPSEIDDASTLSFLENVLIDPPEHRIEIPSLWERRDTPAPRKGKGKGLKGKGEAKDTDEDDYCEEEEEEDYYGAEVEEDDDETYEDGPENFDEACEQLCIGISHINMSGEGGGPLSAKLPPFQGKHIRFNYNSDDEMEEEVVLDKTVDSPGKVRLNGLPTPKGKHIRFDEDDEESSSAQNEAGEV